MFCCGMNTSEANRHSTHTHRIKSGIFKHWPPLVRAYRQNAAGMELSRTQKNYLKWGTILIVAITSTIWCILSLPYFQHQADVNFFTYSNGFIRQFFDNTNSLRISEFIWRFVAQFYLNVPLILLVVAFMVTGFCITSWKTAGPYTPFLLPIFFLTFPSSNPAHASIAISLWLIMLSLSLYFILARMAAKHRGAVGLLILMHLLAAILSVALYYATGHWALMFSITVVCIHLIGVPMAFSAKEKRLLNIRMADLAVSSVIAVCAGLFFWKVSSFPGFNASWYLYVALIVFFLACVPGIVLQVYNNQKTYLYETARKHGKIQDGKPALASPYHPLLALVATGLTCFLVFICGNSASLHTIAKVENAVTKGDYAKSLKICDRYFQKYGILKQHPRESTLRRRYRIASYLRLSLLMEGELNNRFLDYSDLHEMNLMYPAPLPFIGAYDYSYIKTYENLELFGPAIPQILSNIELFGIQNRFVEPLIHAQVGASQIRLLQTVFYYARKSLYCNKFYKEYKDTAYTIDKQGLDGTRPVALDDPSLHEGGGFIDQWVRNEVEYRLRAGDSLLSPPLLDYYTFLMLMEKRIEKTELLLRLYRMADAKTLPRYLQEFLCIYAGYPLKISKQDLLKREYHGYRPSLNAATNVLNVFESYRHLQQRRGSFEETTQRYGSTYTYHYLFNVIR